MMINILINFVFFSHLICLMKTKQYTDVNNKNIFPTIIWLFDCENKCFLLFSVKQDSDFTDMDDWPTLGDSKKSAGAAVVSNGVAKQNGGGKSSSVSQEDSDESQSSQINNQDNRVNVKKGKPRTGWLPLSAP